MAKVRCNVCANVTGNLCKIKKIGVKPNKARNCKAFIYDENKTKPKKETNTIKVSYMDMQRAEARRKADMKALREAIKKGPNQGTAKQLGLIDEQPSNIILPGDPKYSMPKTDMQHPLTGDLSRFMTTANKDGE